MDQGIAVMHDLTAWNKFASPPPLPPFFVYSNLSWPSPAARLLLSFRGSFISV
jgi:hypothetical protein